MKTTQFKLLNEMDSLYVYNVKWYNGTGSNFQDSGDYFSIYSIKDLNLRLNCFFVS